MDETDTQIVDRVLSGETDAFEQLVSRHQRLLYDLSFRLTRKALLRFLPLGIFSPANGGEDSRVQEPMEAGSSPDARLAAKDMRSSLESAISTLPEDLKTAFVLYHLHKNPVKDISEALGISPNAVNIRIFKARERLAKELGPK